MALEEEKRQSGQIELRNIGKAGAELHCQATTWRLCRPITTLLYQSGNLEGAISMITMTDIAKVLLLAGQRRWRVR